MIPFDISSMGWQLGATSLYGLVSNSLHEMVFWRVLLAFKCPMSLVMSTNDLKRDSMYDEFTTWAKYIATVSSRRTIFLNAFRLSNVFKHCFKFQWKKTYYISPFEQSAKLLWRLWSHIYAKLPGHRNVIAPSVNILFPIRHCFLTELAAIVAKLNGVMPILYIE